ncbi:MAG: hypothetical protein WAW80_02895 [Candidatus Saccharimonadales bacterium]
MSKAHKKESTFEKAFRSIELATWNRPRTSNEIESFLSRREQIVVDVEL